MTNRIGTSLLVALGIGAAGCGSSSSSAGDDGFVSDPEITRLVIEVDSVPGFEPRAQSIEQIERGLSEILDKLDGVDIVIDGMIESRGADYEWTFSELRALADETFDLEVPVNTAKMHALFIDGRDDDPDRTLFGLAWDNRHHAIWKDTIEGSCAGILGVLGFCDMAERAIWTHEIGHNLGLVNNGLPMVEDHEDQQHPAHDVDDSCVMYWAYDGAELLPALESGLLGQQQANLGFCAPSLADIAAASAPR